MPVTPVTLEQMSMEKQPKTTRQGRGKTLLAGALSHGIKGERGFSLIETMAAIAIIAMTVTGSMAVMSATVRSADRAEGNVKLLQLVRSQIEAIKHAPFRVDPNNYEIIPDLPEGITIAVEATDGGAIYFYPAPDFSQIEKVIQKITITATQAEVESTMTFYKLDTR